MTVYYLTILTILFFCTIAQRHDYKANNKLNDGTIRHSQIANICIFVVAFWLIIVAGHRYYIGTDFGAYYFRYDQFANNLFEKFLSLNEPGFGLIAKIAMLFHDDGTTVLTLTSLVTIGLAIKVIKDNTNCFTISVLLFVFLECWHVGFNAVRQCLAVTIVFCGYKDLKEGNFIKYLLYVFIGFLFHKSAIVMSVIFFLARREVNLKNIIILLIGTIAVLFSYDLLFDFQAEVLNETITQYDYVTNAVNTLRVLANVAPAIFFLIFRNKKSNRENDFYMNMLLVHAAIAIASSNSTYLARMMTYTAPFVCIAIPELLKTIKPSIRKWAKPIILLLFCIFWLYDISISPALNPFVFIWEVL